MTDWKEIGKRVELRKRLLASRLSQSRHRISMFKLRCELRVLLWYERKLETVRILGESYSFQERGSGNDEYDS